MSSYTKAIEQFTARYAGEWKATVRAVQATGHSIRKSMLNSRLACGLLPREAYVTLSGKHGWDAHVTSVQARGAKKRMTAAPRRLKHQIRSRLIHDRRNTANPIKS